ncbi:hypothetical protein EXIGLDRAFT_770054 [Exidia glandulosa HHB12029]|uniref:Uncharacterized protein n=1 Tax=Exidia glandulosa HHB12029 TaxID=1314781 RepID=A0A165H0B2_EXIGL|nr:hypothetical protein EXIGLDRAFT_770054 [Exidia glandulosa HHB12029]
MADWPMPPGSSPEKYGQFVIAAFDAVEAVACLDDDIASRSAGALPQSKFLGVVVGAGRVPMLNPDGRHRLSLEIYLIGQGLPLDKDPAFSVPIAAANEHPSNRPSPILSSPLPWTNFYVHSLCNFLCLVSRIHYDTMRSSPFVVKKQRHEIMLQTTLRYALQIAFITATGGSRYALRGNKILVYSMADRNENVRRNLLRDNGHILNPPTEGADADVSYYTDESEGSEDSLNEVDSQVAAVYAKTAKVKAFVEIWTDLSTCDDPVTLANPKEFLPLIRQIDAISRDYEARMMSQILSKPDTGSWVAATAAIDVEKDSSRYSTAFS